VDTLSDFEREYREVRASVEQKNAQLGELHDEYLRSLGAVSQDDEYRIRFQGNYYERFEAWAKANHPLRPLGPELLAPERAWLAKLCLFYLASDDRARAHIRGMIQHSSIHDLLGTVASHARGAQIRVEDFRIGIAAMAIRDFEGGRDDLAVLHFLCEAARRSGVNVAPELAAIADCASDQIVSYMPWAMRTYLHMVVKGYQTEDSKG